MSSRRFLPMMIILMVFLAVMGVYGENSSNRTSQEVSFSAFLDQVEAGQIATAEIKGDYVYAKDSTGATIRTYSPHYPELVSKLRENSVDVQAKPTETTFSTLMWTLFSWVMLAVIIGGVWLFMAKQMQGGGKGGAGGAFGFGRSRAKLMQEGEVKVTFDDVAGIDEAKEDLEEIVDFLRSPDKFSALGGKIPRGCLLVGSPGTGKTLLAKAIAGEASVPFFSMSGSDFVEMFVGVGASRVRDLFEQAKKNAPCLIFIDEIDAVGRHRGAGIGGGNDEREQTLNQLLVEMDGFEENEGVIVIAATNRPDVLDSALLRPGRFDRQIVVPLPDILGRDKILKVHTKGVPLAPDVDTKVIARGTPGFSGADLANLVNEASLLAARNSKKMITMRELEYAKDKIMMGAERKSMVMDDEEKRLTAYHEAGHAIVAIHCPESHPIHKATIIPRGRALGMVMRLPEKDQISMTRGQAKADLAVAMGGRVAEEIIFGHEKVTSGASSDIKMATDMATSMVTEWGMSDKVGPLYFSEEKPKRLSATTAGLIESEIKELVETAMKRAETLLKKHSDQLEKLAQALLEYETLTGDEINDLLAGKKVRKPDDKDQGKPPRAKKSSVPITESAEFKSGEKAKAKKPKAKPKIKPATEGV